MSDKNKTIEQKTTQLKELVAWFESEDFVLEKASDMFKQAQVLASEIEDDLKVLKNEIEIVKKSFDQS